MSYEARNDAQAKKLIEFCHSEGVASENIVRLLNYHFDQTYSCDRDVNHKATIRRIPTGSNYAPPVIIWKQQ